MCEELSVLYRDDDMIAVYKPSGILVHRTALSTEKTAMLQILRDQINQKVHPVHRLDRPTSGVLLFALNSSAAAGLCDDFRYNRIKKTYRAIVRGWLEDGKIEKPLKNERGDALLEAATEYKTLQRFEIPESIDPRHPTTRYSLLEINPLTGRMHQIRRHMKNLCHPIAGDTKYGEGVHNRLFRNCYNIERLLLSAESISLCHPVTKKELVISVDEEHSLTGEFFKPDSITG